MVKEYSGDARIDGLLSASGTPYPVLSWQSANELGTAVSLDFSFLSSGTNGVSGFAAMNTNLQAAVNSALTHFESVANITFNQTGSGAGDMNFGTANFGGSPAGFTSGTAYTSWNVHRTHTSYTNANVYLTNASFAGYSSADTGSSAYATLLHEIGHGMGLDHSFTGVTVPAGTDSDQYTVMSYTEYYPHGVNPTSLMLYDIMAIQYLYGANTNYNSDDTVIDLAAFLGNGPAVLWDGGGNDTVSLANLSFGVTFDLTEGTFNTVNNTSDFVIAYNAAIENVIGSGFADTLIGTIGNNTLTGGLGDDILDGGVDIDTALYTGASGAVEVYLNASISRGADGYDRLYNIENLTGSSFNDRLIGDAGDNTLDGGDGNDIIKGKGGTDVFYGGDGNDTMRGNVGDDMLFGGAGIDILVGLNGLDQLFGGDDGDFLYGGRDSDIVNGDAGNDVVKGNLGNDTLNGDAGVDDLRGGGNNDILDGGADNDFLFGEGGADTLNGGAGNDVLSGGFGGGVGDGQADVFIFADAAFFGSGGFDRIKDFENGLDTFDLTGFGFTDFTTEVATLATDVTGGLRIDFGFGDVLFVENFLKVDFDATDVLL